MPAKSDHMKVPKFALIVLCGMLLVSLAFCILLSNKLSALRKNSIDLTRISVSLTNKPIDVPGMERLLAKEEGRVISIIDSSNNNNLMVIYFYPNYDTVGNSAILWNTVVGKKYSAAGVVSESSSSEQRAK